jgi:hypothetical protein
VCIYNIYREREQSGMSRRRRKCTILLMMESSMIF